MGFLAPKIPKPDAPANPAQSASAGGPTADEIGLASQARSLIGTSSQGLKRKAMTQRTSLIGG
jgi:hypothetical protein